MSQARAISKPPPNAAPSIAAMVGTGRLPTVQTKQQKHRCQSAIQMYFIHMHLTIIGNKETDK